MENKYYHFERHDILGLIKDEPIKTALDVGCATAKFGARLKKEKGCEVWGVEPVSHVAQEAANFIDKVISAPYTENVALPENYFDAIFFNDVLEHLVDPWAALRLSKKFLKPTGYLYASIPNFLYFNNIYSLIKTKDWKYTDAGTLDRTHLRFFTRLSMIRLFEEAGYSTQRVVGINPTDNKKFQFINKIIPKVSEPYLYTQYFIQAKVNP